MIKKKKIIDNFLKKINSELLKLPFKVTERNKELRQDKLKKIASMLLTDDERAEYYGLKKGCRIREGAKILSPTNLRLGKFCWIGENAIIDASGGLEIGDHCSIGPSVFIWSHSSHLTNLAMKNEIGSNLIERKSTKIGNGCFIAGPSVILPGVSIGDNVLVRPFTTISRNIPSGSLVDRDTIKENIFTQKFIIRTSKKFKNKK